MSANVTLRPEQDDNSNTNSPVELITLGEEDDKSNDDY